MDSNSTAANGISVSSSAASVVSSSGIKTAASASSVASSAASKSPSVASLCNLGNTCFLNSVVYTLRFTPGFTHNLHHLVQDIGQQQESHRGGKANGKGKHPGGMTNGHSGGGGGDLMDAEAELSQEVIEQLHDLFKTLSCADETADSREPIPPSSFLNAVSRFNPRFEGNEHQDAHELLLLILNILEDIKIPNVPATTLDASAGSEVNGVHPSLAPVAENPKKKKGSKLLQNGRHNAPAATNSYPVNSAAATSGSNSHQNGIATATPGSKLSSAAAAANAATNASSTTAASNNVQNFVKENFVGKSVMRFRCLECEASTFQSDTFTNIHVPLHFEDPEDAEEMSGRELVLKQIMMSETLRENNKYWCEECRRTNEAQLSVHYELLPKVLVLQLKRFTAAVSSKSYMSKINDYFPTPFTMNCFCAQCMPQTKGPSGRNRGNRNSAAAAPKHHYRLYAVIMHLGASLASGHYIAYVRASDQVWDYLQCQRGGTVERNKNKKGILKFLRRNNDHKHQEAAAASSAAAAINNGVGGSGDANGHHSSNGANGSLGNGVGTAANGVGTCRSANCCGIRGNLLNEHLHSQQQSFHHPRQRSVDSADSDLAGGADGVDSCLGGSSPPSSADDLWLECDDESIQLITRRQFEEMLSDKQGSTTPYLLFYQRL